MSGMKRAESTAKNAKDSPTQNVGPSPCICVAGLGASGVQVDMF